MKTKTATTLALVALTLAGCGQQPESPKAPTPTTQPSTPMENKATSAQNISPDEKEKLKAIYDSAPAQRDAVDATLSHSKQTSQVNQQNGEASKLEAILKKAGWIDHTVTEGVKEKVDDGYLFKLEVIVDGVDYSVVLKTDESLSQGTVISKNKASR